jgi:hypothetical protein
MGVYRPTNSGSDAHIYQTSIDLTANIYLGWVDQSYDAGFRFPIVKVPRKARILTAKVTLQASNSDSGTTANVRIYGETSNLDEAALFTTYADFVGRPKTTAYVNWSSIGAWTADTDYDTPDIKTIIQEIVNLADWRY